MLFLKIITKRTTLMRIKMAILFTKIFIISLLLQSTANAEPIDSEKARIVAKNKISELNKSDQFTVLEKENIYKTEKGQNLFYVFEFNPTGYMVISAETNLPPVIVYSFNSEFTINGKEENPLVKMLNVDLKFRLDNISKLPESELNQREMEWKNLFLNELYLTSKTPFEQWPPEGTTSTGGWLETNWTQGAPYNNFCPIDPVTGDRSIAGCPAVALAMIINYFETVNETFFSDVDDYYHSYSGRNYWIDDDFEENDFPSFPDLNAHLDTLNQCFYTQTPLKENQKAAINFACGVAARQVYTSTISGTFGVSQAFDAYMKFGFEDAILLTDNDTSLYTVLSQNMMDARPVHLAVVDPPGTMGHNVVIDGYNTEKYFHLNFGWGGSYNGWYLLPDEIPYGLTVIEGAIANIAYPQVISGIINKDGDEDDFSLTISPNPILDFSQIEFQICEPANVRLEIYTVSGQKVITIINARIDKGTHSFQWNIQKKINSGIYICKLEVKNRIISKKLIIR